MNIKIKIFNECEKLNLFIFDVYNDKRQKSHSKRIQKIICQLFEFKNFCLYENIWIENEQQKYKKNCAIVNIVFDNKNLSTIEKN